MLLKAAQGDRDARDHQAVATMPLWWNLMPEHLRHNIDARFAAWCDEHPHVTHKAVAGRKLAMFLPHLKGHRAGAQRLAVAARIASQ